MPTVNASAITLEDISTAIRDIPDYPKPGILFKDITTVVRDATLLKATLNKMAEQLAPFKPAYLVGIEARGFIFGAALADRLGAGFIPVRKKGKLPGKVLSYSYALEYGVDCIELHEGAVEPGSNVIIVDDLLATGGTAAAASELVAQAGGNVVAYSFMIELDFLNGRQALTPNVPVLSLLHYD
ncbi:MAG: adenine phosphoribosyltransferase [Vampirovibrionales bacterium]